MSDSRIRPTWIVRFQRRSDTCIRRKKPMSTYCENSEMIEMSDSRIRPTWIFRFRRRSDTGIRQEKPMSIYCKNLEMIEMSDSRIRPTWIFRFWCGSDTCIRQKSRCPHIAKIREWLKCRIRESDPRVLFGFDVGRILVSDERTDVHILRKFGNDWNVGFENPTYMDCSVLMRVGYVYPTKETMFTPWVLT